MLLAPAAAATAPAVVMAASWYDAASCLGQHELVQGELIAVATDAALVVATAAAVVDASALVVATDAAAVVIVTAVTAPTTQWC